VVSILSFFLMLHLIRTRNAARVSSLQYFVPPVTMLIAWPVFGEALSLLGFMGLFITAGGFYRSIVASRLWRSKKARIYRVLQDICLQGI
jgi:drug/metabolite transporter (DMT)-like permease